MYGLHKQQALAFPNQEEADVVNFMKEWQCPCEGSAPFHEIRWLGFQTFQSNVCQTAWSYLFSSFHSIGMEHKTTGQTSFSRRHVPYMKINTAWRENTHLACI